MKKILSFLIIMIGFYSFGFGLTISPIKYEFDIAKGQEKTAKVKITNTDSTAVTLYLSKEDFVADDDSGTPRFIPQSDPNKSPYGLANWITAGTDHVTLAPGETQEVDFTVKVPENGEPGGHYGALFFSAGGGNQGQVAVVSRFGVLILINVPGEVKMEGSFDKMDVKLKDSVGLPAVFGVKFKNSGNIHIKPRGKIIILDDKGNQLKNIGKEKNVSDQGADLGEQMVDYLPVNDLKGNVLPMSERTFDVNWQGFGYKELDSTGKAMIKFKGLEEYYADKAAEEKKYLKFWEQIKEVQVTKKFTAQLSLSYDNKDGTTKDFNDQKEFTLSYKETQIGLNYYIIGGGIFVLILVLYYVFVGRKNAEKRLREKLMEEMSRMNAKNSLVGRKVIKSSKTRNQDELDSEQFVDNQSDDEDEIDSDIDYVDEDSDDIDEDVEKDRKVKPKKK